MCLLTVNAGSSSIKFDVVSLDNRASSDKVCTVSLSGIGQADIVLHVTLPDKTLPAQTFAPEDLETAMQAALEAINDARQNYRLAAVGHRIVHGGLRHESIVIDDDLLVELEQFAVFDPEHMPAALRLVRRLREQYADIPHVACFDTAFFADLPAVAQTLPLPSKYSNLGLKRYGFHGLSYTYLSEKLVTVAGEELAHGRIIMAHLGSGASLAATKDGRPIDTTMSFTPASGIPMSSRSGDLDPGIALFLQQKAGLSLEEFTHMVNHEAGLLGVSGLTADMKSLIDASEQNQLAALAVDLFCYRVRLAIGSLSAALGGVDAVVISGGIGEQSATIRSRILSDLAYLGVQVDEVSNKAGHQTITTGDSRVPVFVIPTDESASIVREVATVLNNTQT